VYLLVVDCYSSFLINLNVRLTATLRREDMGIAEFHLFVTRGYVYHPLFILENSVHTYIL
jgi:hypothetical protein